MIRTRGLFLGTLACVTIALAACSPHGQLAEHLAAHLTDGAADSEDGDQDGKREAGDPAAAEQAIVALLQTQEEAWNEGDLEAFMDGYVRGDELCFTSGGNVQRGWETTLERYRARYGSSPVTMGNLTFSEIEVHPIATDAAWVLGRWHLEPSSAGGVFTLVLRQIDGAWRIVHDHTSTSES